MFLVDNVGLLYSACATINDALVQGRKLKITLEFFEQEEPHEDYPLPIVDVTVTERRSVWDDEEMTIFSDLNFETVEDAIIAIGGEI